MTKVYTITNCRYCEAAKSLLKKRDVEYKEIHFDDNDDDQWQKLFKLSGMRTAPQIFHNEKVIGGYQDLLTLDKDDKLESLKK